ncbi:MAG: hypothetical protein OXE57_15050 [Alphaproteobacteria bacterium]|nr:hypothetical protein [Alphaproteobacteria bacterium]
MSPEMIAIVAVGVALAGLMLRGHHSLDKRISKVDDSLSKRIDDVNNSLGKRMDGFDERLRALETAQAELKGLVLGKLDFIERYIIARNLQASGASPEPGGADE